MLKVNAYVFCTSVQFSSRLSHHNRVLLQTAATGIPRLKVGHGNRLSLSLLSQGQKHRLGGVWEASNIPAKLYLFL